MTDIYIEQAKEKMGTIERLMAGLPGVRGYIDKELRRDADYRLRQMIAAQLEEERQHLLSLQTQLMRGGLRWLGDVDRAIQKVQILTDRVKHASYGYAGLFDAVKVREEQLDALHQFDLSIANRLTDLKSATSELEDEIENKEEIGTKIEQVAKTVSEINTLFNRRHEAILDPDLLY